MFQIATRTVVFSSSTFLRTTQRLISTSTIASKAYENRGSGGSGGGGSGGGGGGKSQYYAQRGSGGDGSSAYAQRGSGGYGSSANYGGGRSQYYAQRNTGGNSTEYKSATGQPSNDATRQRALSPEHFQGGGGPSSPDPKAVTSSVTFRGPESGVSIRFTRPIVTAATQTFYVSKPGAIAFEIAPRDKSIPRSTACLWKQKLSFVAAPIDVASLLVAGPGERLLLSRYPDQSEQGTAGGGVDTVESLIIEVQKDSTLLIHCGPTLVDYRISLSKAETYLLKKLLEASIPDFYAWRFITEPVVREKRESPVDEHVN